MNLLQHQHAPIATQTGSKFREETFGEVGIAKKELK